MEQYEIMLDGVAQPGEFATMHEANAAAMSIRSANPSRSVGIRPKPNEPAELDPTRDPAKVLLQASSADGSQSVIFPQGQLAPEEAKRIAEERIVSPHAAASAASGVDTAVVASSTPNPTIGIDVAAGRDRTAFTTLPAYPAVNPPNASELVATPATSATPATTEVVDSATLPRRSSVTPPKK